MANLKKLNESDSKLYDLIKTAIEREASSQKAYKEALGHCADPLIRSVLEQLYKDEVAHEKKLQKLYAALRLTHDADGKPIAEEE